MGRWVLIFIVLTFVSPSWAVELFQVNRSVRALGMGNAYVSVVRDSDAIFYNPAGIGMNGGVFWTIADPNVGLNGADALTEIQNFQSSGDFASAVSNLAGKKIWIGGGAKTAVRLPFTAFSVYNNIDASVAIDDPANQELELNYVNDFGYALGFGMMVLPFTYFGVVAKHIKRTGAREVYDPASLLFADFDTDLQRQGTGISLDAGLTFVLDTPIAPAFSLVMRNIGGTTFRADSGVAPPSDDEEWAAGASIVIDGFLVSMTPSLDLRYLNDDSIPLDKKLHLGVELSLPLIDIRAGLHQNYWTAGLGIGLGPVQLDLASWGVELGDQTGDLEDRRYMLQLTLEFGLDLGIGQGSGGGGRSGSKDDTRSRRSRLKQRR